MILGIIIGAVFVVLLSAFWFRKKTPILPPGLETSMLKSDFGVQTTQALLEKVQTRVTTQGVGA